MSLLLDHELLEYIREDVPYFDLTTHMLTSTFHPARLDIYTRGDTVVACSEEAGRVAELLGAKVVYLVPSKTRLKENETVLSIEANGDILHQVWKLSAVLLEYACGMATYANEMLKNVQSVNAKCEVFVTRKNVPFAKKLSIRAMLCGGVLPHRLGLGETIVIFSHHRALFKDKTMFLEALKGLKQKAVEKKIIIECKDIDDAKEVLSVGADVIQMDKSDIDSLVSLVTFKNAHYPHAKILATGGINKDNAAKFAQTGVDALVTSSPYQAKMTDLGTKWSNL